MARAQAKRQRQTKTTTQPNRARSGGRARGISNHPLSEEVERQRQLPPRGAQRKATPTGNEVKRPMEPAPVRRRGRAKDLEMPAEE
jgi:hypothetical protein